MYKFIIKSFDDNFLTLKSEEASTVVSLDKFSHQFYSSRNFPFVDHFLPKVFSYFSPVFNYNDRNHAFLVTQMRPTQRSFPEPEGSSERKDIYFPWSFFFVLVNLDDCKITESHLFFGKNQMMSEDYHRFYIPNVKEEALDQSKFFIEMFGLKIPLYHSSIETSYSKENFGLVVNELHDMSLEVFLGDKADEVSIVKAVELLKKENEGSINNKFLTYFNEDSFIEAAMLDEFSMNIHGNPPSFLDLAKSFLEK